MQIPNLTSILSNLCSFTSQDFSHFLARTHDVFATVCVKHQDAGKNFARFSGRYTPDTLSWFSLYSTKIHFRFSFDGPRFLIS